MLYTPADSTPTLAEWDFTSDNSKWNFLPYSATRTEQREPLSLLGWPRRDGRRRSQ
ncbi:MAG: hypothetical protein IKH59_06045 [Bacteroidaceae bacterium]|nr:hypothetical protein [Bacteroidaceae bacterium]